MAEYPFVKGQASGMAVGLPEGQMGNSEVGHLNMGAGRIVYQELTRITKEIEDGTFFENEELVKVPLLGKITAGSPIEAIERPNEFFNLPASLIPAKETIFTLNVSGESMINAGIFDGDIVIVQKQNTARNGDIVVAMTNEFEVTLKTFYKEKDHIRLQPENDTMTPIIFDNVTILGKAIGLYRKF